MNKPSYETLTEDQFNVMMSDPLTYFVFQALTVGDVTSRQQLSTFLENRLDYLPKIDKILERFQSAGVIECEGDRIVVNKAQIRFNLSRSAQAQLVPTLIEIAARRALVDLDHGQRDVVLFASSDDSQTAEEIRSAIINFRKEMRAIGDRARDRKAQGMRLIGLVNSPMACADFIKHQDLYATDPSVFEAQLERREMRMRQAAHDLLPAISALKLIKIEEGGTVSREVAEIFRIGLDRISKIAKDLLNRTDQLYIKNEAFDVSHALHKVLLENSTELDQLTVTTEIPIGVRAMLPISESQLARVVTNLLKNAYEASLPHRKSANLRLRVLDDSVEICVRDEGHGFSEDQLFKVRRGDYFTSKLNGNGVGLRYCIETLHKSGGSLQIRSAENKGTEVVLVIPINGN